MFILQQKREGDFYKENQLFYSIAWWRSGQLLIFLFVTLKMTISFYKFPVGLCGSGWT
jgi:hypothetical protein